MIAKNFYTQVIYDFFSGVKKSKGEEFIRDAFAAIRSHGKEVNSTEVGAFMLAGLVAASSETMSKEPHLIQAIMTEVLLKEVDWDEVATVLLVNENAN